MPNWLEYAELLQQFVPQKLSPDATDCASIWIVLHRNRQPVALVRDMMMARMQSLLDARRLEEARSCGDLLVNAAQQTVALGQAVGGDSIADAMQLRSRVYAAQLDHAAAIKELEDALALAPTSRPYLWVELARLRHARRHDEPTALALVHLRTQEENKRLVLLVGCGEPSDWQLPPGATLLTPQACEAGSFQLAGFPEAEAATSRLLSFLLEAPPPPLQPKP